MTSRELLKQQLDRLSDEDIQQIAQFIEFLQFRLQQSTTIDNTPNEPIRNYIAIDDYFDRFRC